MLTKSLKAFGVVILFGSCLAKPVSAGQLLGDASNYNVFTLGNFTQSGTDSLGRVAVGGKFDPGGTITGTTVNGSGSYSIASNNPNTPGIANLVVGGNYRNGSTTVNGNAVIGGNASVDGTVNGTLSVGGDLTRGYGQQNGNVVAGHNITYTGPSGTGLSSITAGNNLTVGGGGSMNGSVYYGGTFTNNNGYQFYSGSANAISPGSVTVTVPIDFTAQGTLLKTLSSNLDALTTTGTMLFTGNTATNTAGQLTLTGTSSTQDIFHITGSMLSLTNQFTITGKAGETIVVNVDGSAASMSNFAFTLNGVDKQHVLFNFANGGSATTLTLNGVGIQGTILAPNSAVNFAGGNIDGTIIANTLQGAGESHEFLFQGNVTFPTPTTSTPEPATVVTGALGAAFAAFAVRRKRRTA